MTFQGIQAITWRGVHWELRFVERHTHTRTKKGREKETN